MDDNGGCVQREEVVFNPVVYKYCTGMPGVRDAEDGNLGYVQILRFTSQTPNDVERAVRSLKVLFLFGSFPENGISFRRPKASIVFCWTLETMAAALFQQVSLQSRFAKYDDRFCLLQALLYPECFWIRVMLC